MPEEIRSRKYHLYFVGGQESVTEFKVNGEDGIRRERRLELSLRRYGVQCYGCNELKEDGNVYTNPVDLVTLSIPLIEAIQNRVNDPRWVSESDVKKPVPRI